MNEVETLKALDSINKIEALLRDVSTKLDKLGEIDTSIDYLAAAMTGENPLDIAIGQNRAGRVFKPKGQRE